MPASSGALPKIRSLIVLVFGGVWTLYFCWSFFTTPLSNNREFTRINVLAEAPELVLDTLWPTADRRDSSTKSWFYLIDRIDMVACTVGIALAAWMWGNLAIRLLARTGGWEPFSRELYPQDDHSIAPHPPAHHPTGLLRFVLSAGLGLALVSLATLLMGLAGCLNRSVVLALHACGFIAWILVCTLDRKRAVALEPKPIVIDGPGTNRDRTSAIRWLWVFASPFLLLLALGAMLPSYDFDVNEYHFQGPKEFLAAGRITWLPHNAYTSFPFATEMLTLHSMVLHGDWYRGAVAGKCLLALFIPLTGLTLLVLGTRLYSPTTGRMAALIWLSTPWAYRIGSIAYAEGGLACYLTLSLLVLERLIRGPRGVQSTSLVGTVFNDSPTSDSTSPWGLGFLFGAFLGTSLACKYPGLVSVVVPLGIAWIFSLVRNAWSDGSGPLETMSRRPALLIRGLVWTIAGGAVFCGPWLTKNWWETGNPVYPLGWTVFGGADWDGPLNDRWRAAHSSTDFSPSSLWNLLCEIAVRNDWQGPVMCVFVPLSVLTIRRRPATRWLLVFVAWLFFSCWYFTHRLDRFWVPMLPVVALLSAHGFVHLLQHVATAVRRSAEHGKPESGNSSITAFDNDSRQTKLALILVSPLLAYSWVFSLSPLGGYNSFLSSFDSASRFVAEHTAPEIVILNQKLPAASRVLSVGDAEMFEARFPVVYNTVFDFSIFEEWSGATDWEPDPATQSHAARPLKPTAEILDKLQSDGITHIYVNWLEILRYRSPGNYGYTDFVAPSRFAELQKQGILGRSWEIPSAITPLNDIDPGRKAIIDSWENQPTVRIQGETYLKTFEVFPVKRR